MVNMGVKLKGFPFCLIGPSWVAHEDLGKQWGGKDLLRGIWLNGFSIA